MTTEEDSAVDMEEYYDKMFSNRYTEEDTDFQTEMSKPVPPPPCVMNWYTKNRRNDWGRQGRGDNQGRGGYNQSRGNWGHHGDRYGNRGGVMVTGMTTMAETETVTEAEEEGDTTEVEEAIMGVEGITVIRDTINGTGMTKEVTDELT
ncbi:RNA guanine-N7 methyltransferase activating subunit-like [Haliotis rubra]|uniref:RNA guanine-N7 methyltransferase activating subunit-like n=1 Tax=Haliotis rubra TaxID=36100 RepID=UPI001EE4F7BD|nr:RNA guanine-N7 methyltransferase activating subunit-like [Haliotis rubra]XP_046575882.1 RNA guanine-N7 methyltransferase activating subunit-like [Haliotis rubra]